MSAQTFTHAERRVLVALRSGPLYRPALELIVGLDLVALARVVGHLRAEGLVRTATEIGPATLALTQAGEEAAR